MFSRPTKIRLGLFLVIAVVGIGFTGARYAGLDRLFGGGGYAVVVEMPDSGGIFVNSEVTYRGVAVGRVTDMRLTDRGAAVDLHIDAAAPPIPAAARAAVANRSAVGEQYIDLRPDDDRGPVLADGSVIPEARTEIPPSPESVLLNLDQLVSSVPLDSLRTVVDESGTAFQGTGPHLQRMLDSTGSLIAAADRNLPQTTALLDNSDVVLRTQQQQAEQITTFSRGLRDVAEQFKSSDPDLRRLIDAAPPAAGQIDELLRTSRTGLQKTTANLLTTMQLLDVRGPALENMLVALPMMSASSHSAQDGDGRGHLGVVLNFFNPLACEKGYEGTERRPGSDTTPAPPNRDIHCAEPPGSPTNVRGSANVPRAPVPDAAAIPAARELIPFPLAPAG
ncbi:MCE family protein [Saccharopolyspora sp. NFXS83]|uniref:MCE family protein n=1 Tax=Saccharopolyspora sp. NFXS83 TaxID=2993560 RepID=UPI00224B1150|nr:MCE family protein [Saccharopolyspora sp. NFXS83]MCX2730406.1 MCE family protein [Saccharopolyspora sp. NFXS83]